MKNNLPKFILLFYCILFQSVFSISTKAEDLSRKETATDTTTINRLIDETEKLIKTDITKALELSKEIIKLSANIDYKFGRARGYFDLGKILVKNNESLLLALEYYNKSLKLFTELENELYILRVNVHLGILFRKMEEYEQSFKYLNEAYPAIKKLQDFEYISIEERYLGLYYLDNNIADSAKKYLELALESAKHNNDTIRLLVNYINYSGVYYLKGDYNKSIDILKNIEDQYRKSLTEQNIFYTQIVLALNYFHLGEYKKADYYRGIVDRLIDENTFLDTYPGALELVFTYDTLSGNMSAALKTHMQFFKAKADYRKNSNRNAIDLYNVIKELNNHEFRIEELELEKEAATLRLQRNRLAIIMSISISFFLFISGFMFYRLYKIRKQKNIELEGINLELQEQKHELQEANKEISAQRENLYDKNEELIELVEKLTETQNQLIQSEKMASIGTLAAGVAHEINNPLNFIQGGLSGLEDFFEENPQFKTDENILLLAAIEEGIERATIIVRSLNHFNRQGDTKMEACNLNTIIDNCLVILKNQLKNKVEIIKDYNNIPPIIKGNDGKLHQAILNLLTNSEQSIEKKGEITIKTTIEKNNIVISIRDNGSGMDESIINRITEPFFTTKEPGMGTGLGLSITYNIIEEHFGKLEYKSEPGKGTTATITLPIKK